MNREEYISFKEPIKEYIDIRKATIIDAVAHYGRAPKLAIVQVGDNYASNKYVGGKMRDCEEVGIECELCKFDESITEEELAKRVAMLGSDHDYDGIIVQLPLPDHIRPDVVTEGIPPYKDVDGFKVDTPFVPCTPLGIYNLLTDVVCCDDCRLDGKHVVILGRSDIVGKPMAKLLIEETDATVTVCNSHTQNLADITRTADILISAIGKPRFVTGDMVKPDTIIIDVGINRSEDNKLCGDVDAESFDMTPKFITPVPGGVGLLTRLSLLENVCDAYMLS